MAFIILIRNLVLAGILAWLGIELAPSDRDEAKDSSPKTALFFGH